MWSVSASSARMCATRNLDAILLCAVRQSRLQCFLGWDLDVVQRGTAGPGDGHAAHESDICTKQQKFGPGPSSVGISEQRGGVCSERGVLGQHRRRHDRSHQEQSVRRGMTSTKDQKARQEQRERE